MPPRFVISVRWSLVVVNLTCLGFIACAAHDFFLGDTSELRCSFGVDVETPEDPQVRSSETAEQIIKDLYRHTLRPRTTGSKVLPAPKPARLPLAKWRFTTASALDGTTMAYLIKEDAPRVPRTKGNPRRPGRPRPGVRPKPRTVTVGGYGPRGVRVGETVEGCRVVEISEKKLRYQKDGQFYDLPRWTGVILVEESDGAHVIRPASLIEFRGAAPDPDRPGRIGRGELR